MHGPVFSRKLRLHACMCTFYLNLSIMVTLIRPFGSPHLSAVETTHTSTVSGQDFASLFSPRTARKTTQGSRKAVFNFWHSDSSACNLHDAFEPLIPTCVPMILVSARILKIPVDHTQGFSSRLKRSLDAFQVLPVALQRGNTPSSRWVSACATWLRCSV